MSKKEYYGWDQYKEEGLAELKKIKKSKIFIGKDKFQQLLDRYIETYSRDNNLTKKITGTYLYPEEFRTKSAKHAHDKAYRVIREFKVLLGAYYEKGEGKNSAFEIYFISQERDYRLGVREKDQMTEDVITTKIPSQSINLYNINIFFSKIGDKIINFLGIYYESLFAPYKLATRASINEKFRLDSILVFLFSTFLALLLAYQYREISIFYLGVKKILV
ncbi:MAG: hypothetical protein RMI30_02020 [Thermodesulfovibrio sp.]|nr:hypothetical protein [Thermodesulfovibrio sp.]MDW7998217.1 hypothetical protein [Thermodesulfovibrio sp.]